MPSSLPPKANLEYLKKQAKALLRDVRRKEPQAVEKFRALRLKAAPRLSDAQLIIAREYGFESWPRLKERVVSLSAISDEVLQEARRVFQDDDAAGLRRLLRRHRALKVWVSEPAEAFGAPLVTHVRSREMLDVLLDVGANINTRSRWWAGGFGLLDCADPDVAAYAVSRGAVVTVHAAARLGMLDRLRELITADPKLVHARGGDGQTPLHFASTVEVAEYLLDQGAEIDARDVDHESTPAQYMVRTRQDVARYLIRRGCATDILMAAALGDAGLALKHLDADPECIRMRVSDEYLPMVGSRRGGTIYQWELGWYVSACQVARSFGHDSLFGLLMERSPDEEKLLNACWLHDEQLIRSLVARQPDLAKKLPSASHRHVAHAARNNDTAAARLMLVAGLPAVRPVSQHHASALHWAAWHGNAELVRLILLQDPPLEDVENEFGSTPLGWAVHGSEHSWSPADGDYASTVEALLDAGARPPEKLGGTDVVRALLQRHRAR